VPPRLAILDLAGDERGEVAALLRASAREREPQVSSLLCELVDEGQVRAAVRGAGYTGSLNLSREEARALGMSIGCEFYILGKVQIARRIVSATEFYYEALTGLFLVETRSGRLALFACSRAQAADETQARAQLAARLRQEWARYAAAIAEARDKSLTEAEAITRAPEEVIEVFTDAAAAGGLQPPVFYQRLKPAYTEEAGLAGITATVELEAVFQADGRVGAVEVVRWAGFGLDEAAVETVRQLRFKPAMRDGRPLSIRGLVHYNFRRTPTAAERQEELERLRRSLRPIRKGD
jgi:TonB family protein